MHSDIDDIYYEIGDALYRGDLGARHFSRDEKMSRGKQWLANKKELICNIIKAEKVQLILKGRGSNTEDQVRFLIDIFASSTLGVPPNAVARAVLFLGEEWFCGAVE